MMRQAQPILLAPPILRLEGQKTVLKTLAYEQWGEWSTLRAASRAHLTPWEPIWSADALTETAFERRVRRAALDWQNEEGYAFHVFERTLGKLVGGISLTQVRHGIAQTGTIGYWIGERYAGQGYTTDATRLLVNFAFRKLGLHRVEAACIPTNLASQRVLEKLDFVKEGYARRYLKIAGIWVDHHLYAMVEDEWR